MVEAKPFGDYEEPSRATEAGTSTYAGALRSATLSDRV